MRHYEIVFLVHPDQSEQVPAMIERYRTMVTADGGQIHRIEDWGRRQLAHSIAKLHKAHYVLMNVECDSKTLDEIKGAFRFSDAVLRHLVILRNEAITELSLLAKPDDGRADDGRADNDKSDAEGRDDSSRDQPAVDEASAAPAEKSPAAEDPIVGASVVADIEPESIDPESIDPGSEENSAEPVADDQSAGTQT